MHNHRLLVSIVIIMGVLVLAGASLMTYFAFKKMKGRSASFMTAQPLNLGAVSIEHMSVSSPHIYLLTKNKTSGTSQIIIIDEGTQAKVGEIALSTNP